MRKIFFTTALLLLAPLTHAQISVTPDPIQYTVAPETPGPGALVYISIAGVGPFLGNATITWQQDGKIMGSAVGATSFAFKTGAVGTATHIHVNINSSQGTYSHDWVFSPSVVDLVWEANTSAPLFYMGKPLYSAGSQLKVVAFPTVVSGSSLVSNSKLSFQWSRGGSLVPSASGLGKNVFAFAGDEIQNGENVSVDLYLGNSKVGSAEIFIPAQSPSVILYDQDPLRGELLDLALPSTFNLNTNEVTLKAEPYFFDNTSVARGALSYAWTLGGSDTTGPDSGRGLLTLRQTSSGAGAASVGVSVQNNDADKFTQAAQSAVNIVFGQQGSSSFTSLFGL